MIFLQWNRNYEWIKINFLNILGKNWKESNCLNHNANFNTIFGVSLTLLVSLPHMNIYTFSNSSSVENEGIWGWQWNELSKVSQNILFRKGSPMFPSTHSNVLKVEKLVWILDCAKLSQVRFSPWIMHPC
jgi:hypothetical protein